MSTFVRDARHHSEKIEHYYENAGATGYSQARHHADQLNGLLRRAHDSAHGKSEAPLIQAMIQSARPMMDEMLRRQKQSGS